MIESDSDWTPASARQDNNLHASWRRHPSEPLNAGWNILIEWSGLEPGWQGCPAGEVR